MHPVPGVRYGSYRAKLREDLVWTCPVHEDYEGMYRDPYEDEYDDVEFDFPVYGCTCDTSAKWKGTGVWRYVIEGILNEILRNFYLPPIIEQMNNEILLGQLMKGTP
jgi:hypothetical protein